MINIGLGMVKDVVLNLPYVGIGTNQIHDIAQESVDPWIFGIGSMDSIMHHAHSYSCHSQATTDVKSKYSSGAANHSGTEECQWNKE
jgi:hypothetical protein